MARNSNRVNASLTETLMKPKHKVKATTSIIESLPRDLLAEIFAKIASNSLSDLSRIKLISKSLLQAVDDDYIYQHASTGKYHLPWLRSNKYADLFLQRCERSGNREVLYRRGMHEYFTLVCTDSGLDYLKRAADKKHPEATYVYSIIALLGCGIRFRKQGFELLSSLKRYGIGKCRRNISEEIYSLWIHNAVVDEAGVYKAETCNCLGSGKRDWDGGELIGSCESCLCVTEVNFLCDLLKNGYVQYPDIHHR